MIQLVRLEPKLVVVLDAEDEERMIDREHYEQTVFKWYEDDVSDIYWGLYVINDFYFRSDLRRYLTLHHTLNTIGGLKIPID